MTGRPPILRPGTRPPWVIAHRGASSEAPENTLAAFDLALSGGCDGIELDLQLSEDGVPVVFHDWTLARAGLRWRRVGSFPASTLAKMDVGSAFGRGHKGESIPTLDQVLSRYAGRKPLLLEIKTRRDEASAEANQRLAEAVVELIRRRRAVRGVYLLGFHPRWLEVAAQQLPGLRIVLNAKTPPAPSALARLADHGLAALSLDIRCLDETLVRAARRHDLPVMVFTCNTPAHVRAALAAGVDVIMTDRLAWLRGLIQRHAAAS